MKRDIQCTTCGVTLETEAEPGELVKCANCGEQMRMGAINRALIPSPEEFVRPMYSQALRAIGILLIVGGILAVVSLGMGLSPSQSGSGGTGMGILMALAIAGVTVVTAFPFFAFAQILDAICRTAHEARRTNVLLEIIARK